jgi:hypothetical protein
LIPEIKDRFDAATANVKSTAIKGLFAKDVASALVTGSIFLILAGTAYGLAQFVDPALAAVAVGGLTLLTVAGLTFMAAKSFSKK